MTNAFSLLDQFFCLPVGMLSKSKGQILRVSAAFHVLFDIPQFLFTEVIFSPLAQMLVVQQYTGQVISNLIGKILTVMTPGQPGTIGNHDSILETAKLSCRLFLHFLFWQLTLPDLKMIVTLYSRGVPQKAVAIHDDRKT